MDNRKTAVGSHAQDTAVSGTGPKPKKKVVIRLRGSVDRPFLILVILMVCLGSIMVFSSSYPFASQKYGEPLYFIIRQAFWAVIGFAVMAIAMQFDYRFFQKLTIPAFIVSVLLLLAVPVIGTTINGAKRWIYIGPMSIQPSEIAKLTLVMVLALYISKYKDYMHTFRYGIMFPYAIIGGVCFITIIERHMSGTIILFLIGTLIVFIGGASVKVLGAFAGIGGGILGVVILFSSYARERVEFWLHPENDPSDSGYQLLQSLYAIGSGGFLGTGLGNSRQKHLYLPESQNDFIFAVICEEFGLVGAVTVICLFAALVWRGIHIAMRAPDTYSSLLVFGIIVKVALQSIMNIAVVTGTMPVTGVSLPFFSYGGSSLIMLMFEMGMVLAVSRYSYQDKL